MRVHIAKALTFAFTLLALLAFANALPSLLSISGRAVEATSRISPDNTCGKSTTNRHGYVCDAVRNAGGCCSGLGWCGVGDGMCILLSL